MKKLYLLIVLFSLVLTGTAHAQFAAQRDAANMIITKVIADYKLGDDEYLSDVNALREDQRFTQKLEKMLQELQNTHSKNSKNQRIVKILQDAGAEIDKVLNIRY